jgi:hypothetical protein
MLNDWTWSLDNIQIATGFFYRATGNFKFNASMPNVTDSSWMFYNSKVTSFNCQNMPKVTNCNAMFRGSSLNMFNAPLHFVNRAQQMFQGCSNLSYFQQPDGEWNITNASNMFDGTKLEETSIQHVKKMLYNNKHTDTLNITIGVRNDIPSMAAVASNFNVAIQTKETTFTNKNGGVWNITFQYN